jgi:hypothetical protein
MCLRLWLGLCRQGARTQMHAGCLFQLQETPEESSRQRLSPALAV